MAYLFNNIDDDGEDTGKSNIFGGQQTQQGTTSGEGQVGGAFDKGGSQSSGGGGGGGSSRQPQQQSSGYNPKASSDAFKSVSASIQAPAKLGEAQGTLAENSKNLQEKANAYQQKSTETAKSYDLPEETIKGAAEGQTEAYKTVGERLTKTNAPTFEAFGGLDKDAPNVDYVADTGRLFGAQTGGQQRFDAALGRANSGITAQQQQILARQKALEAENKKQIDEQTQAARTAQDTAYKQSTDALRGKLGGMANDVVSSAKEAEKLEDARRAALDPSQFSELELRKIRDQVKEDLSKADPRSAQYRALRFLDEQFDVNPYINIDRDVDWQELVSDEDAQRYNRLQGLLGGSDMLQAGKGPGETYSVDQAGAYNALMEQLKQRREYADQADMAEMARIQALAEQRAKEYSARDETQNASDAAMRELAAYGRQRYGTDERLSDLAQLHAQDLFENPGNFQKLQELGLIRDNAPVSWQDVLSPEELSTMNELTQDVGGLETYRGGYQPEYNLDALKAYYDQYITPFLQQYTAPEPKPVTGQGGGGGRSKTQKSL